ncbi:MAG: Asp-tRNA(Asn)/Glu-tRNA(Gln) amidotransferase subunit GatA [Bacteroidales bacterium]|nr:Asp-tRNA(Asn)/Glu-tRNA(Gln) amidotransferase subunit GatA [Bacteroidales bacterium]MEE1319683.1 Asp-tRNA(Asn)/Glu-tRNA(Gln) amidotransferase subunit GatA [Ruminococcus sp.]
MSELTERTIFEHAEALRKKEYSSVQLTQAYLEQIDKKDKTIGAYITVTADRAIESAKAFDEGRCSDSEISPLAGIPCGIKDNMCTKGIKTTCASKMLGGYIPPYSAHVVEKLEKSGAVILGKLNMDEFAMGSTTENSAFKVCRNPLDTDRVPGGSSGGSAAAVAAREAVYTLGSDTGGSIRQPASFCGVVGMKPTYGSVSRYGLVAFASSLDQIGPITSTVLDNALVLNAIVGHDKRDATSVKRVYNDFTADIKNGVKGMKIGVPEEFFGEGISDDVRKAVLAATDTYRALGAELVSVSMPSIDYALSAYYVISSAEASSNLARFDGVRYGYRCDDYSNIDELYRKSRSEGFGSEVKKRIMLGTFALSSGYYDAYYKKALQVRSLVRKDFDEAFGKCDFIISPVAPTVAYKIGEKTGDSLQMYMGDAYSVPVNIAGIPALTLPCGIGEGGMPVGMQLIGPAFSEGLLYRAGFAFESTGK